MAAVMSPKRERVVVTGGSGFIGRAVVAELARRQVPVTGVDREPFPADVRLATADAGPVTTVIGDLRDADVRSRALSPDTGTIVHLAALTSVLRSVETPVRTYEDNVEVTQHLLEAARHSDIPRFVLASTNAVVGDVGTATISAELPLRPLTPYGATKAACEMLLSGYAGAYGVATCPLRFTNVSGTDCVVHGFPGVSYVAGDDGEQVGKAAHRDGAKGDPVTIADGETAYAAVGFVRVENYEPEECEPTRTRGIRVYPPQETRSMFLELGGTGCASEDIPGEQLVVQAIRPGAGPG
jgi:nucleoside-diphosphate-sugar epimerase